MKNHSNVSVPLGRVLAAVLSLSVTACGGPAVEGNTYAGGGDVVKVEFKADGQAYMTMGPISVPCTYSQKGKVLTLTCEGEATEFKIDDDGALLGPPEGMLGRLTQQKK
jgi:hypothetical protein